MAKKITIMVQKLDEYKRLEWSQKDLSRWAEWQDGLENGCYEITVKKSVKNKSQRQLGAHFGLLIKSALEQADAEGIDTSGFLKDMVREDLPSGVALTADFLKHALYIACPMYRDGKTITLSKASTEEASKHFEDCRNHLAGHGIYIEQPKKDWKTIANQLQTPA